jgi:hypothetical protein
MMPQTHANHGMVPRAQANHRMMPKTQAHQYTQDSTGLQLSQASDLGVRRACLYCCMG